MSFIDDIVDFGKDALGFIGGNSLASNLAKTALLGLAVNQLTKSVNPENSQPVTTETSIPDAQTRLQNNASPDNKIPIVYGSAVLGGSVTDAYITEDLTTMYWVLTICEQTGALDLGQGDPSEITFRNIYWNDLKVNFQSDGITVASLVDRDGNVDDSYNGILKFYCYSGNSESPVVPLGYSNGSLLPAQDIMPNWNSAYEMNDLVFAIVRAEYNTEKNLTGLATVKFHLDNTMNQPGDCIFDYMTSHRYGAGIDPSGINSL